MKQLVVFASITFILIIITGCFERNSSGIEPRGAEMFINPDEYNPVGIDSLNVGPGDSATVYVGYLEKPEYVPEIKWTVGDEKIIKIEDLEFSEKLIGAARVIAIGDSGQVSTITAIDVENNSRKTITVRVLKWVKNSSMFTYIGTHQNNLYFVSKIPAAWFSADEISKEQGGHLVTIRDKAENDFVAAVPAMLDTAIWMDVFIPFLPSGEARNFAPTTWGTGEPFDYQNWESGYPEGVAVGWRKEALAMNRYGKWENIVNVPNYYVVELEYNNDK